MSDNRNDPQFPDQRGTIVNSMIDYSICKVNADLSQVIPEWDIEIQSAISTYVNETFDDDDTAVHDGFNRLLLYIHNTVIGHSGTFDSSLVPVYTYLFNVYLALCIRYNVLPTFGMYCLFTGIDVARAQMCLVRSGMRGGLDGGCNDQVYNMLVSVNEFCKALTIDRLHNLRGSDANLIFISKACYGLTETAPVQTVEHRHVASLSDIADSIGIEVTGD